MATPGAIDDSTRRRHSSIDEDTAAPPRRHRPLPGIIAVEIGCRMRELVHPRLRPAFRAAALALALAAFPLATAPAAAQDYAMRDVGGWTVAASKDKSGCFLTRTYSGTGGTTLFLGLDVDGSNHLSVLNDNWSIKPNERLNLTFKLSNGGYAKQPVIGMASEGKRGFVTTFEAKFLDYFSRSRALQIFRGTVPVDQLDLAGSGDAVGELRKCVAVYKGRPAAGAKEERRSDRIPADPFASSSKRKGEASARDR
jgi:hypothetical protein